VSIFLVNEITDDPKVAIADVIYDFEVFSLSISFLHSFVYKSFLTGISYWEAKSKTFNTLIDSVSITKPWQIV
jgi:hypothetical protein